MLSSPVSLTQEFMSSAGRITCSLACKLTDPVLAGFLEEVAIKLYLE